MVGIAQNVTALERQLQTVTIERDRLKADKEHLTTVNGIQADTIRLLQSERDRYFAASESIGQLCETLADGLVTGVKKWQENKATRATPMPDTSSRIVQAAAPVRPPSKAEHQTREATSIPEALAKLNEIAGRPPQRSADMLPRVDPE